MGIRNCCKSCCLFMYNKENSTFCKKTCSSWSNVFAIYLGYTIFVVACLAAALYGLEHFARDRGIQRQVDKRKLIADNFPKLVIFPRLDNAPIIWYKSNTTDKRHIGPGYYVDYLDKFFEPYEKADKSKYVDCSKTEPKDKHCLFTKDMLGPCGQNGYGYYENKPCIFLKLNKMRRWLPWAEQAKNPATVSPKDEDYHDVQAKAESDYDKYKNTALLARCGGATSFGCDHIGEVEIKPTGIFYYFFPYDGSKDYLSPLIGVKFTNIIKGMTIAVNCSVFGTSISQEYQYSMLSDLVYFYIEE